MPGHTSIQSLVTAWQDVNGVLTEWKTAIEAGLNISFGPGFEVHRSKAGTTINLKPQPTVRYAVTTSTITALSGSTLGSGTITLYDRTGATIAAGLTGQTCYSRFTTATPSGTRVIVAWVDGAWSVVAEDCA